jgi:hypothetical protein
MEYRWRQKGVGGRVRSPRRLVKETSAPAERASAISIVNNTAAHAAPLGSRVLAGHALSARVALQGCKMAAGQKGGQGGVRGQCSEGC